MTLNELIDVLDEDQNMCIFVGDGHVCGKNDAPRGALREDMLNREIDTAYARVTNGNAVMNVWLKNGDCL